jgi:hypothetical protein
VEAQDAALDKVGRGGGSVRHQNYREGGWADSQAGKKAVLGVTLQFGVVDESNFGTTVSNLGFKLRRH